MKLKTDLTIPELPKLSPDETEINIKPELLSTEQKYTITDTHFVQPPELPLIVEKQTIENLESPPKLPDFTFELPPVEPISIVSKDTTVSPPSFEDDVPSIPSKIVPAIEISTPPIKSTEKQVIESKSDIKKKSSALALCSCFGDKSGAQKEKPKTIKTKEKKTETVTAKEEKLETITVQEEQPKTITTEEEQPKTVTTEEEQPKPVTVEEEQLKTVTTEEEQPKTITVEEEKPKTVETKKEKIKPVKVKKEKTKPVKEKKKKKKTY